VIDDGMKKAIELLANEELIRANMRFPQFASTHEGYSVLKEEIEEVNEENENMNFYLETLWKEIKANNENGDLIETIQAMKCRVILNASECIQVIAMCDKLINIL